MASYRFKIARDPYGLDTWEFTINPQDIAGLFPPRPYNAKATIGGISMFQFPRPGHNTQLLTMIFDGIPDERVSLREFLLGESEGDIESLQYLKRLDPNGRLTIYYLMIPETYKQYRPEGYRDRSLIPIQVEDVNNVPVRSHNGLPIWHCTMNFRIVPIEFVPYVFTLDDSRLDSQNVLATSEFSKVYVYDYSLDNYTDVTSAAYSGGSPFPTAVAINDRIIAGHISKFNGMKFYMDTLETIAPDEEQGDTIHSWKYWKGSWENMTPVDDTDDFTKTERAISWGSLADWSATSLDAAISGAPATDALYWVYLDIGTVTTQWDIDKMHKM